MFNGGIPVVLDTLKQHYFIDRDGKLFRHILNYMRTSRLTLPENFDEFDSLIDEAKFYELNVLIKEIENLLQKKRKINSCDCTNNSQNGNNLLATIANNKIQNKNHKQAVIRSIFNNNTSSNDNENSELYNDSNTKSLSFILIGMINKASKNCQSHRHHHYNNSNETDNNEECSDSCKILVLNHTENSLYISGESALIKSLLPELDEDNVSNHIILNSCKYATKFCLDGSLNIHHIEIMERLCNNDFILEACYGGGLEGQQFNEYIFIKFKN